MKRKLLFLFLILFVFSAGMVTAATSQWKGFDIVKIFSSGKELKATDTPAVIIQGRSYVPLYMLREAGLQVTYDASSKSVTVEVPKAPKPVQTGLTLEQLNKIGESVGLIYQLDAQGKQIGTGSGFVTGGYLITNYHVTDGLAVSLLIDFGTIQKTVKVSEAVFKNETADLIGFKIDGAQGLTLNTGELKKGDKVYSLSYPHHRFQVTEGEYLFTDKNLFHTAPTESGSSGGPVVSGYGEVIGVTVGGVDGTKYNAAVDVEALQGELSKLK